MEFQWQMVKQEPQQIKYFLKEKGVSKGLLAKIKFQGGRIEVDGVERNVLYLLQPGESVKITVPDEGEHETLQTDLQPLDIIFEDEHYLIVNKPAGVASIPAQYHPTGTMANRVKAYYQQQQYPDQVVHIVTRLDRDTTGLMLFAKHSFAHALMDQELRQKRVTKRYQALVSGDVTALAAHDLVDLPIGRQEASLMQRMIRPDGQVAQTEYWLQASYEKYALVRLQLHTGRTHQIRVHMAALGTPLLGDDMYGGALDLGIERQALHCYELAFNHPFTQEKMLFNQALPADMARLVTGSLSQENF